MGSIQQSQEIALEPPCASEAATATFRLGSYAVCSLWSVCYATGRCSAELALVMPAQNASLYCRLAAATGGAVGRDNEANESSTWTSDAYIPGRALGETVEAITVAIRFALVKIAR